MLSLAIITLLLSLFEVVDGNTDPPTDKAKGDSRNPIMDTKTVYLANNTRFERVCIINGGVNGVPVLEFKAEAGMILKSKGRLTITKKEDPVKNITTGTFVLDPATDDDNIFKIVLCRHVGNSFAISTQFILNVIPDVSIPSIKIDKGTKTTKITKGATANLTCTLSAKISGGVREYSIGWAVDSLETAVCLPSDKETLPVNTKSGPVIKDGDTFTSVLTISKADLNNRRRFFCAACMKFGSNIRFDIVKQYNDSIYVDVLVYGETDVEKKITAYIGEDAELDCEGIGMPLPTLTWFKKGWSENEEILPFDERYSFNTSGSTEEKKRSAVNSVFKITGLTVDDRSQYICRAEYKHQNVTIVFTLRVRDRYGHWWPVLGIMIEAFVLYLIIVLCDQYKQKRVLHIKKKEAKKGRANEDVPDAVRQSETEPLVNSGGAKISNNEVPT